jgi:hypothetical protein
LLFKLWQQRIGVKPTHSSSWNKGRVRTWIKGRLKIDLLPFAVSHNKVVKTLEDIGTKSFKFGPFRGII